MTISARIKSYIYNRRISVRVNQYKYVHIIYNDKFCKPFIEFINEKFSSSEHVFLVQNVLSFEIPDCENVFIIHRLWGLDFSTPGIKEVIMHSLFIVEGIWYWAFHQKVLKTKAWWMIYGKDLYKAPNRLIHNLVRKSFKGYISDTDGDCEVVKEKYKLGDDKLFINAGYTFPITNEMLDNVLEKNEYRDYIRVQINNSCDSSTIPMMSEIYKLRIPNVRIAVVVSYGDLSCKNEVLRIGKELFGDSFEYLDKYLSPADYTRWLSQNDVFVLCQDRQQGIGNSFASLALGSKLFIRSDVTTFGHFNNRGIKVYDTLKIKDLNNDEFLKYDKLTRENNMKLSRAFFDNDYLKELWKPVFEE